MKTYLITYGSGLAWPYERYVDVEDWQHEQDALDLLVDELAQEDESSIVSHEYIAGNHVPSDEYVCGGNDGLYLLHYGVLEIKEVVSDGN